MDHAQPGRRRPGVPVLDGSHFKLHPGARAEAVLVAWAITTDGTPVLVGLAPASAERHAGWADFLAGLVTRGLRAPLLVVSDGAEGSRRGRAGR
jgi:putative transposase